MIVLSELEWVWGSIIVGQHERQIILSDKGGCPYPSSLHLYKLSGPGCSFAKLLAFALLHFGVQGQVCLLLQVSLDFLLLHSSPL